LENRKHDGRTFNKIAGKDRWLPGVPGIMVPVVLPMQNQNGLPFAFIRVYSRFIFAERYRNAFFLKHDHYSRC